LHVTIKFLDYCKANKILLATYPPHSTHTLQPPEIGIFSLLPKAYSDELEGFLHASQGLRAITKQDFFRLFWKAWDKAVSPTNIKNYGEQLDWCSGILRLSWFIFRRIQHNGLPLANLHVHTASRGLEKDQEAS
jgi:hypothetical protein